MNLKQVTQVTMTGLAVAFAISLLQFPWRLMSGRPGLVLTLVGVVCLYGSLLFFLFNLHRKG